MPTWNPGPDPFPAGEVERISDFEYHDELKLIRHARVHVRKTPESLWQLSADFRVSMTVHLRDGTARQIQLTAPRGLYTDLASVPKAVWSIIGPVGGHLESSIVHDYLYMAWTDFHDEATRADWNFADKMFLAGMMVSGVRRRFLIYGAVRLFGWPVFRAKSYTLEQRMEEWLEHLESSHGRDG